MSLPTSLALAWPGGTRWLLAHAGAALDGMGMAATRGILETLFLLFGCAALLLSAALGAAAWATALRGKLKTSGGVFARGFLGVSAVLVFFVGVTLIAFGQGRWLAEHSSTAIADATLLAALALGVLFLAVEFAIAGTLYWRVARASAGTWPKVLAVSSYGLGAVFGLAALLGVLGAVIRACGS